MLTLFLHKLTQAENLQDQSLASSQQIQDSGTGSPCLGYLPYNYLSNNKCLDYKVPRLSKTPVAYLYKTLALTDLILQNLSGYGFRINPDTLTGFSQPFIPAPIAGLPAELAPRLID